MPDLEAIMETDVSDQPVIESLPGIASTTLAYFGEAASSAEAELKAIATSPPGSAFASVNTLTAGKALQNLSDISDARRRDLAEISQRPAIARVEVRTGNGLVETIFITSATPERGYWRNAKVTSYRSPKGRLAAIPVGGEETIAMPGGAASFEILAKAQLRPFRAAESWDSLETIFERSGERPITIASLRALLKEGSLDDADIDELERLFAEDRDQANVAEGLRRAIIERMGLRERPLLDQYQDEIFRLPLATRLAILGPPGSGKTTTLIKRLGLKIDLSVLEDDRTIVMATMAGLPRHADSWLMFTPTELLRQYIKEAFARERVAASDHHIQVWEQYSLAIARNRLGILRSSTSPGAVLREHLSNLDTSAINNQPGWFDDFEGWQANFFWSELRSRAKFLSEQKDGKIASLGNSLLNALEDASETNAARKLLDLRQHIERVSELLEQLQEDLDQTLRRSLVEQVRSDKDMLNQLVQFVRTLNADGEETDDGEDEEEEEELPLVRGDRELAFENYKRSLRAQARALARNRKLGARTRNGRIFEWLGDRKPSDKELEAIGSSVIVAASLRRFANPLRHYLAQVARRYRRFRRIRLSENIWYAKTQFAPGDLGPLEVDVIVLVMLRAGRAILADRRAVAALDEPSMSSVRTIRDLFQTQVIADEATDFSPIQLACMASLSDPAANSFTASGDFNQRVTSFGSRSLADFEWAVPDLDVRQIAVTYRHSKQLNAFAHKLALLSGEGHREATLPEHVDNQGVDPVLGLALEGNALVEWLRDRIVEIEGRTARLPSIAVLVASEEDVEPLAAGLDAALSPFNVRCDACPRGQVRGQDEQVRVFDVQHIKGLEFEAVFFVDVDKLAEKRPDVFEKYLYVGSTRAAMYLALTTSSPTLPALISGLESEFANGWATQVKDKV